MCSPVSFMFTGGHTDQSLSPTSYAWFLDGLSLYWVCWGVYSTTSSQNLHLRWYLVI